jgi:uncharacterized damage-inducible protein DinB
MSVIDREALSGALFDAFGGKASWPEAAARFTPEALIATFQATRSAMRRLLEGLTDAQAAYVDPSTPIWSISETITHLVYTQNYYHNQFLDLSSAEQPHMAEAARGFGEGAREGVGAEALREMLDAATTRFDPVLTLTLAAADRERVQQHELFGPINYAAWLLLLLGHESDHYRQSVVMRRLARAALPEPAKDEGTAR